MEGIERKDKMKSLLIRMPPQIARRLRDLSERNDRSVAMEVRRAVTYYLDNEEEVSNYLRGKSNED